MANTGFRARLARLFRTQVVVRKVGKNKIRVIDTSKLQSSGTTNTTRQVYSGVYKGGGGYYRNNNSANFYAAKTELYRDYEAMDEDPVLASALDIYADESTKRSPEGVLLEISSGDDNIKSILSNLFYDIVNIEFNLWPWIRNTAKYGDFFLVLSLQEEYGITSVTPVSSYEMNRLEAPSENGEGMEIRFEYDTLSPSSAILNRKEFEYFEVAHFRLLTDTNFLPYGRSLLEPARKEYKRLTIMEDAMMIHRIIRAPERRVYRINTGNLSPVEVDKYMASIVNKTKKTPYIDPQTGQYNLRYNLENMIEDIYIPTRGGVAQTEVDILKGANNENFIEDVKYVLNKMMAALKIPKAFLGFDENIDGKSVLSAEDIRFSRTIERLQSIIVSELSKIAITHLFLQGYEDASLVDFELKLHNPSIVYERQKVEILKERLDVAQMMKDSKLFSREYIYKNIFNLGDDEIKEEIRRIISDQKLELRLQQLSGEGNDPAKTGEVEGTPGSIAKLHVAKNADNNDGKVKASDVVKKDETRGRPKAMNNFSSKRDKANGRDPLGFKNVNADLGFSSIKKESIETNILLNKLKERFADKKLVEILEPE